MERIKGKIYKLLNVLKKNEMKVLPGHLAFFLVLSVVPIITLFVYLASFFSISLDSLIELMEKSIPKEVVDILLPFISGKGVDIHIGLSMLTVFIVASNGAHSIIVTSNTLYNIEDSSYLKRRIKAFFMTFLLVFLFIFILIVLGFGDYILSFIINLKIFKNVSKNILIIFTLVKWPLAYILILIALKIIFTVAPDKKIPSKYVNRGVQFTTLGWIVATFIFSYYISNFANYDIFYGALSNIIILMIWIYILAYILVTGIAINANIYSSNEMTENGSVK